MDQMKFREDNSYELRLDLKKTDKSAYGIIKSLLSMDHNADDYDGTESQFFPLGEAMFQKMLEDLGVNATIRRRLGTDISAACGQLRREDAKQAEQTTRQTTSERTNAQ